MTTRALAWTALWLSVLLGVLVLVGAQRSGYWGPGDWGSGDWAPIEEGKWEFRNSLLDCKPGTVTDLSPGRVDQARRRFWFLRIFAEPDPTDVSASHNPMGRYAHYRAAVSEQRPNEEGWYYQTAAFIAFRQLGAVGSSEWLTEIRLVREKREDGTSRDLLQASFANAAKARMRYSYDPRESRADAALRGLGWVHMVQEAPDVTSEVFFLEPAGIQEPPPPPKK